MLEFNGVFECDDMDRLRFIHLVDQGCQSHRFSSTCCTSDKDKTVFLLRHSMEYRGQSQIFDRFNLSAQPAQHNGQCVTLLKNIDAKAGLPHHCIGTIAGSLRDERLVKPPVPLYEVHG